jgi:hypothetical protein
MAGKTKQCECGAHVERAGFTNRCWRCGRFYNWNGSLLAYPSQWGEETNEAFSDDGEYIIGSGDSDFGDE